MRMPIASSRRPRHAISMPEMRTVEELRKCTASIPVEPRLNNEDDDDSTGLCIDNDDESTPSSSGGGFLPFASTSTDTSFAPVETKTTVNYAEPPSALSLSTHNDRQLWNNLSNFFLGAELEDNEVQHHQEQKQKPNNHCSPTTISDFPTEDSFVQQLQRTISLPLPIKSALKTSKSRCKNLDLSRNVSFSKLMIREYSVALGDNPSCSYGVPISLGWDFLEHEHVSLDAYESLRSQQRISNRHDLLLSYNTRRHLLKRAGYTTVELKEALRQVNRVKHERGMTELFLATSSIEDAVEQAVGSVKGILLGRTEQDV